MTTPLMRQYQQVKAKYPDAILLFRMGDFFETFEEDAHITSKVLGIVLTKRGNGAAGDVPLAGFPHHALEAYLPKLLRAGYRVAICEQLEDPKFAKGIVKRDVIEVVTPGVAFSEKILDHKKNNYLLALSLPSPLVRGDDTIGFAFVDVSTGEFGVSEFSFAQLPEHIESFQPQEILVQKRDATTLSALFSHKSPFLFTKIDDWIYNYDYAYELLLTHFKTQSLKGFGVDEMKVGLIAAGAILNYLQETQKSNIPHIKKILPYDVSTTMVLDAATRRNLEIATSLAGHTEGTLFAVLDRTQTPMGGRLLKQWIYHPLKHVAAITERLLAVEELVTTNAKRQALTEALQPIGDLERLIARIATGRATPREVLQLKTMLAQLPALCRSLEQSTSPLLKKLFEEIQPFHELVTYLDKAIADDPPSSVAEGGVIRTDFNEKLDVLRALCHGAKEWIARHQQSERERTGIPSLKIGYNAVFGYYIEITNAHKGKVPQNYIRKQTLTNAERYITPELKEYEEKILHAEEEILALETQLFSEVRRTIADHAASIQNTAKSIAILDCLLSLANVAIENDYTRPEVNDSTKIEIVEGRHPVVEKLLPPGEHYTPNDTFLDTDTQQILIITGPNMSGKSSYLRQVGLIVLLAQIGSFVPAKKATLGVVDRIYTRVGASDNITLGESTFLVEMHEAANIVNTATKKSLVLLDEIGRGTSTFDGISIAWALTEYIHTHIGAKTLFATHYHELNELADHYPRIKNYKVDVREYDDKVIFLHKVKPGFADHSYGIQVAQMAGIPEEITERAKEILKNLESTELSLPSTEKNASHFSHALQLTMFEGEEQKLRDALENIDVNTLTPLEALQKLAELVQQVKKAPITPNEKGRYEH